MGKYTRMSFAEREELSRGLVRELSLQRLASQSGRSVATLSREVRRNGPTRDQYRAGVAQERAARRRSGRTRRLTRHPRLWRLVRRCLRRRWSPEQIAARLKVGHPDDPTMQISHEALYTYLYVLPRGALRRELLGYLRQHRRNRRPRSHGEDRRGQIPEMISIEERPAEVAERTVPGHWEGDLVMGRRNQSAVGTLVERTTRYTLLVPLQEKDAAAVRKAYAKEIRTLPRKLKRSLTYDRGKEMAEHELFTKEAQMQVYFAHPQSPWERGTNENTNGLLRQFFPKGTDFSKLTRRQIKRVQDLMNGRPRKTLNWRTPDEAFAHVLR